MLWDQEIIDVERLPEINRHMRANVGIIAVPAQGAQRAADLMVSADIRAILNFAPARIEVPPHVALRGVDLTRELEVLCYHIDRLSPPEQDSPEDTSQ